MDQNNQIVQNKTLTSLSLQEIMKCLPQRYPFLMLDKVIEIDGHMSAIGIKNVTFNEPIFQGHFPGEPIFPGVLIIEGMAQTAGAIVIAEQLELNKKFSVYMLSIDKARFRKPVIPGDRLEYHLQLIQRRRTIGRYYAKAIVEGQIVAEAEVGAMMKEA